MMRRNGVRWLAGVLLVVGMADRDVTAAPAQLCQSDKNKVAGKYEYCRQRAESTFANTGDTAAHTTALAKCLTRYQAKWPLLEAKARGACPSVGDQAAIQSVIDQHTTNIATALGGGGLQDCGAALTVCQGDLATCDAALPGMPGLRLKTGQTTCYNVAGTPIGCSGTGQDGELQKGLARVYTDNGNGTVTDTMTGLMWEKMSQDGGLHGLGIPYTWDGSAKLAMLNSTSFAGFSDWRLPNVNELQSLVDYDVMSPPKISAVFNTGCVHLCTVLTCSCTYPGYFGSSTSAGNPSQAYAVDFNTGGVYLFPKASSIYVRAVRGG